jgi:hypothetical protein
MQPVLIGQVLNKKEELKMKLSEAKQIRAEIIRLCPESTHKARNISGYNRCERSV